MVAEKNDTTRVKEPGADPCRHFEPRLGALELIAESCIECGICLKECGFLRNYGMPKLVASSIIDGDEKLEKIAFSCSLCRLCTVVCPRQLPMAEMFLELRRRLVRKGMGRFRSHRPLRFYEWLGSSPLFTSYLLPQGCRQVFFPGCALGAIRPDAVLNIVKHLQAVNPSLGVVLDCCNKPSHDLGEQMHFLIEFGRKVDYLRQIGIEEVVVGCPSCYQVFCEYGGQLKISMVFSHLEDLIPADQAENPAEMAQNGHCMVHDPCSLRFIPTIQQQVRTLIAGTGRKVVEMDHSGENTLCCGEGGAARMYNQQKSVDWRTARLAEMAGCETITYCAGCTSFLDSPRTRHLVDLLFPQSANALSSGLPRPPKTYLNRLRLKFSLRRLFKN